MIKFLCVAAGLLPLLLSSTGCARPTPVPLPQYTVHDERLSETPPLPAMIAPGDQSTEIRTSAVQIRPETAIGYANLPTTITQLYAGTPVSLSLRDVVVETLANNRGLKIEGYSLRIADYQVPVSKGIYDLMTSARAQFDRLEEQSSTAGVGRLPVESARTRSLMAGLSQLIPTGGTISLGYEAVRSTRLFQRFTPTATPLGFIIDQSVGESLTYQDRLTAQIVQPLLRDFGPFVTNANIRIAQLERSGAESDFRGRLQDTLLDALRTYWELIFAVENYKVRIISYSAALDLLRINRAKYEAGVLPLTDVLQAEAASEARREDIIRARQLVRAQEDSLKRLIFLQEGAPQWDAELLPTQPFVWRDTAMDLNESIEVALTRRPELMRARSNIDQAEVRLRVAKNQTLPAVDLFGRIEANGLDDGFDGAFHNAESGKYTSYSAGIEFSYPLQNRAARYRYKQAQAGLDQAGESYSDAEDQIAQEVRSAVRALRTARERIDVSQSQVRSEEAKLDSEMKRYDVGITTAFQVLEFQSDLATAQAQYSRAVTDYNIAMIELERARGTLMETYGVAVAGAGSGEVEKPVIFPIGFN